MKGNQTHRLWLVMSRTVVVLVLLLTPLMPSNLGINTVSAAMDDGPITPKIEGPFIHQTGMPYDFSGDLRDLGRSDSAAQPTNPQPLKYVPGTEPKGKSETIANWVDPIAQTVHGAGKMPNPIKNFAGMSLSAGGSGWPPDTNGDVSPNHYIQTVNTSIAIYNKSTGAEIVRYTFDQFFTGTGTPCDNQNSGDPVVVYDRFADRWLITDFAVPGPYYQCLAISKTNDPISGGWWMYAVVISTSSLNDYPKIGVWRDGYYMSFNMFGQPGDTWDGVQVWAFEKASMLAGSPLKTVSFHLPSGTGYGSLLPSHALSQPPVGAPNYFASIFPHDKYQIWEFQTDWVTPGNSTFTGPTELTIAEFAIAPSVPQQGSTVLLDSLSFRPMMQLIYREISGVEALWMNHTVASQGIGAVRWYEVRDPGGTPALFQQGTYQPDLDYRWMGSLAVDKDGNMAVGYSVSNSDMYPAIRYTGRLAGETPGLLPQSEAVLIQGTGSQTLTNRWGDYSAMAIDPTDECTFWYTTEYYISTGTDWQTRIGSFKFPSCGQPKGFLDGVVRNAVTLQPIQGAPVVAASPGLTLTTVTDLTGYFTMTLTAGTYNLSAGPLQPGYPTPNTVAGLVVTVGNTTTQDFSLTPAPYLVKGSIKLDDNVSEGNNNGFVEPGETGVLLWEGLYNSGAITSTNITASLSGMSPGLAISVTNATYPNIGAGQTMTNTTPFVFSVAPGIACGTDLDFRKIITDSVSVYTEDFTVNAAIPLPRADVFNNDVESGPAGWTTGGAQNNWAITSASSHSPTHSWTDSPGGNYPDNADSFLMTPIYDLSAKRNVQIHGWFRHALEAGYDYVYLDYSLDGGQSWSNNANALATFNGYQNTWKQTNLDASVLDNQPRVALRFRLVSDSGVNEDGIYIDDIVMSYEPYICNYVAPLPPDAPLLVSPADNSSVFSPVEFEWANGNIWAGVPKGYVITIDSTNVVTLTTPGITTTISLTTGIHTWQVKAYNDYGISPPSTTWMVNVLPDPPNAPELISPSDGSVVSNPVTFEWKASNSGNQPEGYTFFVDGTPKSLFTSPVTSTTMILSPGEHNWFVTAYNTSGDSAASETWRINVLTIEPPGSPLLLSPADKSTVSNPVTFEWKDSGLGGVPDGYILALDSTPVMTLTHPVTSAVITLALGNHTWNVTAYNTSGKAASPTRTFQVLFTIYLPTVNKN